MDYSLVQDQPTYTSCKHRIPTEFCLMLENCRMFTIAERSNSGAIY